MSLLFNILSRLVITFLPRSKSLLISWLQSPSAVILESKKIKHLYMGYKTKGTNELIHQTVTESDVEDKPMVASR